MKTLLLTFSVLVLGICAHAQTYEGPQEDIDGILSSVTQFSKLFMAGNDAGLAACYTEDGKVFSGGKPIIEGYADLKTYWAPSTEASIAHHKLTPIEITVIGDVAYDYGLYEGTTRMADGSESNWQGKYVVVWKKVAGKWLMYLDIWNSSPTE
jgi:ketosteroid isomerase-like protein